MGGSGGQILRSFYRNVYKTQLPNYLIMISMGENKGGIQNGPRPSIQITLDNIALPCENCDLISAEGIISLRPRKEARFICSRCLKLNNDKIEDMKKSGNIGNSNQGCSQT